MSDKPPLPWYKLRWWLIPAILSPFIIIVISDIVVIWLLRRR
jgi:hypothetical protein